MIIHKAILHHYDKKEQLKYSRREINLGDDLWMEAYITRLFKSLNASGSSTRFNIGPDSFLNPMMNTPITHKFLEISQDIAKEWFDYFSPEENRNLLISLIDIGEDMVLFATELKTKEGFVLSSQNDEHNLVYHDDICGPQYGSVDQAFMFYLEKAWCKAKTVNLENMGEFLGASIILNAKDSYTVMNHLVSDIASMREEDITRKQIMTKRALLDLGDEDEAIHVEDMLDYVFEHLDDSEKELVSSRLVEEAVKEPIRVKDVKKTALVKKHKIVTETGIQIILPVDSLAIEDMLDIEDDGSHVTITIHNVGKIL